MIYVGIDVGKDSLVIARQVLSDAQLPKAFSIEKVENTLDAINAWLSKTDLKDTQIIFEATGTYSYRLAYCLDLSEIAYLILSPKQSRGFAQSMKIVSQNDERDAILLSLYGKLFTPSVHHEIEDQLHQLRQKRKHLSSLLSQNKPLPINFML